jgi:TfoX/Sxy family transcriptional regulator of competence genes
MINSYKRLAISYWQVKSESWRDSARIQELIANSRKPMANSQELLPKPFERV